MKTTNKTVANAVASAKNSISYAHIKPQNKWDILDDIASLGDAGSAETKKDLQTIKPSAKRLGAVSEYNRACDELGFPQEKL